MADIEEIQFFLSGGATGAGNSDPTVSLGGLLTSTRILTQVATRTTSLITGVTISDAAGNGLGAGTMTFTSTGSTLQWQPSGGAIGTAIDISADGDYGITSANDGGLIYVTVVAASLPGSNTTDTVTITNQTELLFDNVTKVQSDAGLSDHRMIWIKNVGATATTDDKKTLTIWINANTPGQDNISIALPDTNDVASAGTGTAGVAPIPEVLASETTAPDGTVTFSAPTTEATGLVIGDLTSTSGSTFTKALWVKRVIPTGVDAKEVNNTFLLSFSVKV